MRNIQMRIKIEMIDTEAPVTIGKGLDAMGDGSFSVILDEDAQFNIDRLENGLLGITFPALRAAMSAHLEDVSKKKANDELKLAGSGSYIEEHATSYRVDGEVGRFTFPTYDVKGEDKKSRFDGFQMFPAYSGKQWYQTEGFKELGLICGASQRSYRQSAHVINRSRHQEIGGTPLNTLRDNAQVEGLKVIDFIDKKSQIILKENGFDSLGIPQAHCAVTRKVVKSFYIRKPAIRRALTKVLANMSQKGFSATDMEQVEEAALSSKVYEQAEKCVHIYLDDVGVKEQKEHRNKKDVTKVLSDPEKEAKKDKRPTVQNTVARIENNDKGFTFTGRSVTEVLVFVLGFLLNNKLFGLNIKVCTDGQRSLQDAILSFFSWYPHFTMLLDWFHVVKKFKEDLSLACKGKEIRNRHVKQLLRLLWFGLTDRALVYLQAIDNKEIKNAAAITRLCGYLERNRKSIPCYAMRSELNLPNSSNPVERSNNLVTARRQKHQGMSWSDDGSYALTSLSALTVNNTVKKWLQDRTIDLTWAEKAA